MLKAMKGRNVNLRAALPYSRRVSARALVKKPIVNNVWIGPGWLTIAPGRIDLALGAGLQRLTGQPARIIQTTRDRPQVTVLYARLFFPWQNTKLIVQDDQAAIEAAVGGFGRNKLRRAVCEAGFRIEEHQLWFSLGGKYLR